MVVVFEAEPWQIEHLRRALPEVSSPAMPTPSNCSPRCWGFRHVTLEELLARSDVVTLHMPYRSETHHLINRERLMVLKPGALVVNTARGA